MDKSSPLSVPFELAHIFLFFFSTSLTLFMTVYIELFSCVNFFLIAGS